MSRSGEPGSPRRNMQGLLNLFCSSISPRRGDLVLGDKPSRLGECVSPKQEPVCVLSDLVAHLAQARFIVWARVHLAQARASRLSESSIKLIWSVEVHRLGEVS